VVLRFRSVRSIVNAAARTGRLNSNKNDVTSILHTNNCNDIIGIVLIRIIVTIKLIAPAIELIPAKWRLKIAKSTDIDGCPFIEDSGG
jgi:hypothetical protein